MIRGEARCSTNSLSLPPKRHHGRFWTIINDARRRERAVPRGRQRLSKFFCFPRTDPSRLHTNVFAVHQPKQEETIMFRSIARAGLPLTSLCFVLITSATQAMAQSPSIQVGSDTRAKSQADCLRDAKFAIGETGLQVSFTSGPHIGGSGTLIGAGVAVMVTCLSLGQRTFIEVVGTSLDGNAAGEVRNRVRTITMGPAT